MESINDRIRRVLALEKIPAKTLAKWLNFTEGRLSQKFKEGIWDSLDELKKVSAHTGYSLDWLITGKGGPKPESAGVEEGSSDYGKLPVNRGEFYQELVETNSDYRLIPKSIIEGDYRIILKSELDEMNRTRDMIIEAKNQTIALMDKRITELEREQSAIKAKKV